MGGPWLPRRADADGAWVWRAVSFVGSGVADRLLWAGILAALLWAAAAWAMGWLP